VRKPLFSLSIKAGLALFLVVAGALAIVYAAVVPQLEDRLVDAKVRELALRCGRESRREREPLARVQWPAPGSLAIDVPVTARRPVGTQHRKPQIAAQCVDTGRVLQPDRRRFNGPVRRLERRDETAEAIRLLDDLDRDARVRQVVRGREPGETSPDHRDGLHRAEP